MHKYINVNISGPVQPTSTYKTVVLKGNHSFASQVIEPNMKYVIKWDFDLGSESVVIPENCVIQFDGGSLSNGTIVGQNTSLKGKVQICNISGTFANDIIYTSWFISNPTNILSCISVSENTLFVDKDITLDGSVITLDRLKIDGDGYHSINTPNKIIIEGNVLSIKNVNFRNISFGEDGIFILISGESRNMSIELHNVDFDGDTTCTRFISRNGTSNSSVNAKLNISSCKLYNLLEFGIRYSDCCTGIVSDNEFYNIGSTTSQLYWAVGLTLGKYDNTPDAEYMLLCNYAEVSGNKFHDIKCFYSSTSDSKETHGILLYGNNNTIKDNYIDEIVSDQGLPGNDTEGIYIKGSNNIIKGNTLRYANGEVNACDGAITVKNIQGVSENNIIKGNRIFTKAGKCITLYGNNSTIKDNFLVQEDVISKFCIELLDNTFIEISGNTYIDNVVKSKDNPSIFINPNGNVSDILVKNNIIKCACIIYAYAEGTITFENNNIEVKDYQKNSTKYDSFIYGGGPNASFHKILHIILRNNNISIKNNTTSSCIISTNSKLTCLNNVWNIEGCNFGYFVRSANNYTEDETIFDGELFVVGDIFQKDGKPNVFLGQSQDVDGYYKPTRVFNIITIDKIFTWTNVLYATSINNADKRIGAYADKPYLSGDMAGYVYYDTTYNRFIVWNGSAWKDAIGNAAGTKYIQRLENEATNGNIPMFYGNGYIKDSGKALADIVTKSGTIISGNVPEFDGTDGAVKDSGKAATSIP